MKTITFYSYKGGVGRTLALANTAKRLSEFKKRICLIDFDLEAPGLHLKFPQLKQQNEVKPGIVDYMYEFFQKGISPDSIKPFTSLINFNNNYQSNIDIITAGKINQADYWNKLSSLNWKDFFYQPESQGISFFIELKEKIKRELNPDYLLIDSRTGISEISSISLSLLADEVVVVSAFNEENLSGIGLVLNSLRKTENSLLGKELIFHFVLSRIPFRNYRYDIPGDDYFKSSVKKYFLPEKVGINQRDIIIIHSDPELEYRESLKIAYESEKKEEKKESVAFDYLELFKHLIYTDLKENEIEHFNKISEAENLYQKSKQADDEESTRLLTKAIDLLPGASKFYFDRGVAFSNLSKWNNALNDFQKAIDLDSSNSSAFTYLGFCYKELEKYSKALKAFEKAIKLDPKNVINYRGVGSILSKQGNLSTAIEYYLKALDINSLDKDTLNGLADVYRLNGDFDIALRYVKEALVLDPEHATAFSTLAEIKAATNHIEDFYFFTAVALKLDEEIAEFFFKDPVYKPFLQEQRFQELCERFGINLKDLEEKHYKKDGDAQEI